MEEQENTDEVLDLNTNDTTQESKFKQILKSKSKIILILGVLISFIFTGVGTYLILGHTEEETPKTDTPHPQETKAPQEQKTEFSEHDLPPETQEIEILLLEQYLTHNQYLAGAKLEPLLRKKALKEPALGLILGQVLIGAGQSKLATAYLSRSMEIAPSDECKAYLHLSYIKSGINITENLKTLQILSLQNSDNLYKELYAEALISIGQNEQLITLSRSWPREGGIQAWVARAQMNLGSCPATETLLKQITQNFPNESRAWAMLAYCQHQAKDINAAENSYKWALLLNQEDFNSWYNLGELYYALANSKTESSEIKELNEKSLNALLNAVKYQQNHTEAHYRIGTLMLYNKAYRESIQHFEIAKESNDRRLKSLLNLSLAWKNLAEITTAQAYLDSARTIAPHDAEVWNQIIELEENTKVHPTSKTKTSHQPSTEPITEHKAIQETHSKH